MRAVIVLAVLVLLAGCTAGADSTPSPSSTFRRSGDIEKYTLLPEPHWEACDDDD